MQVPAHAPKPGFYYHHKHDPAGAVNNYAYVVTGVGCHTENGKLYVIYYPLYKEAKVYRAGGLADIRPLTMWLKPAKRDGKLFPRFRRITDGRTIATLQQIQRQMYGV